MKLGIVGFGKMGKLFASVMSEHFVIEIYDIDTRKLESLGKYIVQYSLEDLVSDCNVILVSTPLSVTPNVLKQIKRIILEKSLKDKLIFDIATFKSEVIAVLKKYPKSVKVCSIHPLFGPGAKTIENRKIVIIPVRKDGDGSREVSEMFKRLGAKVIYLNVDVHDEIIGLTISFPYFLGITFGSLINSRDQEIIEICAGSSYNYLLTYTKMVVCEDPDFVYSLIFNEHCLKYIKNYLKNINYILSLRNYEKFKKFINDMRKMIVKTGCKKAYSDFVRKAYND